MKVAAVTEKEFQGQILSLARLSGWRCYHTDWSEIEEVLARRRRADVLPEGEA
ncbi:MAG: hypothetical protein M3R38_31685 [Actinomycetota bacterium]|nr:hypothetical protein [Actinomycetota bacterium]